MVYDVGIDPEKKWNTIKCRNVREKARKGHVFHVVQFLKACNSSMIFGHFSWLFLLFRIRRQSQIFGLAPWIRWGGLFFLLVILAKYKAGNPQKSSSCFFYLPSNVINAINIVKNTYTLKKKILKLEGLLT